MSGGRHAAGSDQVLRWRFGAGSPALGTRAGERIGNRIRVRAWRGCALDGPRVEMPAGRGIARIRFAAPPGGTARMEVVAGSGQQLFASATIGARRVAGGTAELPFTIADPVQDLEVRLFCRAGLNAEIVGVEIDLDRDLPDRALHPDRPVGYESRKTYAAKIASGFFDRYLSGPNVLEIGYKGYDGGTTTIVPQAIGVDVGYAGYDGASFPFADESFDAIYSSHCFEHIEHWKAVLREWHRILRPGGFLVIVVPHQHLFERKRHLPSYFNGDHKRFYTSRSLLAELEEAFEENSYRIRHLVENDTDFDYSQPPGHGSSGCYEIELVVEKIARPFWQLDDGSVRTYSAGEFRTALTIDNPWRIALDCAEANRCLVWGPYITLPAARLLADFHFEPMAIPEGTAIPSLILDVAGHSQRIAAAVLDGERARAVLAAGHIVVPFTNNVDGANFEFRIYVGDNRSSLRPVFKGVALGYARE